MRLPLHLLSWLLAALACATVLSQAPLALALGAVQTESPDESTTNITPPPNISYDDNNIDSGDKRAASPVQPGKLRHIEPVSNLVVQFGRHDSTSGFDSLSQNNEDTLYLAFDAYGQRFELTLHKTQIFDENGVYVVSSKAGERRIRPGRKIYATDLSSSTSTNHAIGAATLHSEGRVAAMFMRDGELYQVEPLHSLPNDVMSNSKRNLLRTASLARGGAGYVVHRYSDIQVLDDSGHPAFLCGAVDPHKTKSSSPSTSQHDITQSWKSDNSLVSNPVVPSQVHSNIQLHPVGVINPAQDSSGGRLQQERTSVTMPDVRERMPQMLSIKRWENCIISNPDNRRNLRIGIAVDASLYKRMTQSMGMDEDSILDRIGVIFAQINQVYVGQFNVAFRIVSVHIMQDYGPGSRSEHWNPTSSTCEDIYDMLSYFMSWTNRPANAGLWHLLTSCYSSGTVGLAHIGAIGLQKSGTGVSSMYNSWTSLTFTLTHELGHNFNASHTFDRGVPEGSGGIMDYGTGRLPWSDPDNPVEIAFHAVNKPEICYHLNAALTGTQKVPNGDSRAALSVVWATSGHFCGDGVVDPDEECDTGGETSPCCTSDCKLTVGSECVSGECCDQCKMKVATPCNQNQGYCSAGVCVDSRCLYYGFTPCGLAESNPCVEMCSSPSMNCRSLLQFTNARAALEHKTICRRDPTSVCVVNDPETERSVACTAVEWSIGEWSECTAECPLGSQTREVLCKAGDAVIMDALCPAPKPATSQACASSECYKWHTGEFSPCSLGCWVNASSETGVQVRTVACVSVVDNTPVEDSWCQTARPPSHQECTAKYQCGTPEYKCRPTTSTSDLDFEDCAEASTWDPCEVGCGQTVQYRIVACRLGDEDLPLSACTNHAPPPPSVQECTRTEGESCKVYHWRANAWNHLSCNACGGNLQTDQRTVTCIETTTQGSLEADTEVDSAFCPPEVSLAIHEVCYPPPCTTYEYVYGDFGGCSKTCGGGVRARSVRCIERPTGVEVDLAHCAGSPQIQESCNDFPCAGIAPGGLIGTTLPSPDSDSNALALKIVEPLASDNFLWYISPWSTCSQVCGGTRTRTVKCYKVSDPSTLYEYTSPECAALPETPVATEPCSEPYSCYYWAVSEFGACSQTCISNSSGELGVMTRSVQCKSITTNDSVDDSYCIMYMKPQASAPCNRFPCPRWVPEPWGECLAKCGIGVSQRQVLCREYGGSVVPDDHCTGDKNVYPTTRACRRPDCPYWTATEFGPCEGNCGEGTERRELQCRMEVGGNEVATGSVLTAFSEVAAQSMCLNAVPETKPPATQPCSVGTPCGEYTWASGGWSSCDKTCGGGTQTRTVNCILTITGDIVNSELCSGQPKPKESQTCNTHSCQGTWFHTIDPAYAQCSVECGSGVLDTRPICVDNDLNVIPDSLCPLADKYILCHLSEDLCALGEQARGRCVKAPPTGEYAHLNLTGGRCVCAQGWSGPGCSAPPEIMDLYASAATVPSRGTLQLYWKYAGQANTTTQIYVVPYTPGEVLPTIRGTLIGKVPAIYETYTVVLPQMPAVSYVIRLLIAQDRFWDTPPINIASPCATESCGPHGTCDPNSGKCICLAGYSGDRCETDICDFLRCHETFGRCNPATSTCDCTSGYSGAQCRVPPNCPAKDKVTCLNGGIAKSCTECECINSWITSGSIAGAGCDQCTLVCNAGKGKGTPDSKCQRCRCDPGWYDACKCPYVEAKMLMGNVDPYVVSNPTHIASMLRQELAYLFDMPITKIQVSASLTKRGNIQLTLRFGSAHCDASFDNDNVFLNAASESIRQNDYAGLDASATLDSQDATSLATIAATLSELFQDPYSDLYRGAASQYIIVSAGLGLSNPNCSDNDCPQSIGAGGVEESEPDKKNFIWSTTTISVTVVVSLIVVALVIGICRIVRIRRSAASESRAGEKTALELDVMKSDSPSLVELGLKDPKSGHAYEVK